MTIFERYRPAIIALHLGGLSMAVLFGVRILNGGSPITPEIYGRWVYEIPALTWVAVQVVITFLGAVMAFLNAPRISGLFSFSLGVYLSVFAAMSAGAGAAGTILTAGAGFWLAPLCIMAGVASWSGADD